MSPRSMSPTAVLVAVLVIVPASAYAETKAAPGVSAQALKAKTDYCKTCHGVDAQGFRGAAPMPRLAGQQPEYIKNQLQAFIERKRTNPVMNNVAHVLSPEMVTALSEYFNSLNPKPLGGGNPDLLPVFRTTRIVRDCALGRREQCDNRVFRTSKSW